jgi:large subunit ribosomal protein L10
MPQIDALRTKLLESGARFSVVKNTLTRRAAEAAGADALLTLLEGPSAVAFLQADGDMVAAAKALADAARETRVLAIKGGVLQGRTVSAEEVESLSKLPPADVLRGQVLGAIVAPIQVFAGLVAAPLQNLIGLIDARIEQLEAGGDTSGQSNGSDLVEDQVATSDEAEAPTDDAAQAAASEEEPAEATEPTQVDAEASTSESESTEPESEES